MWSRIGAIGLGLFLTASPSLLGYGGAGRVSALVAGPLATSVAVIALSEVTRSVRWCNLAIGVWLVASPLAVAPRGVVAVIHIVVGLLLMGTASRPGAISGRYGGGWSSLGSP